MYVSDIVSLGLYHLICTSSSVGILNMLGYDLGENLAGIPNRLSSYAERSLVSM